MVYFLQYHNQIEQAYADDEMLTLRKVASSQAFKALFGPMCWTIRWISPFASAPSIRL
jgi:hypothetical protein